MFILFWSSYLQFVTILASIYSSLLPLQYSVLKFTSLCLAVWTHYLLFTAHTVSPHGNGAHCSWVETQLYSLSLPCNSAIRQVRFLNSLVQKWETRHTEFLEVVRRGEKSGIFGCDASTYVRMWPAPPPLDNIYIYIYTKWKKSSCHSISPIIQCKSSGVCYS
jgi:hypothetical protein